MNAELIYFENQTNIYKMIINNLTPVVEKAYKFKLIDPNPDLSI